MSALDMLLQMLKSSFCYPCKCAIFWVESFFKNKFARNVILLYLSSFFVILPYMLQNVKFSNWYHPPKETEAHAYLKQINDLRVNTAQKYFNLVNLSDFERNLSDQTHDIVVSIITTSRNRILSKHQYKPKYLTQVLWKLLLLRSKYSKELNAYNVGLFICNVDHDSSSYHEANNLEKYVTMVKRFHQIYFNMDHVLEKEKQDYVFCLNESFINHKARYHLLVEDDALPMNNLFDVLHFTIKTHLDAQYKQGEFQAQHDVLYVKFYHPERLSGYTSLEPQRLCELSSLSLLLTSVIIAILEIAFKLQTNRLKLWTVTIIYFIILLLVIGRVNVNQLRHFCSPYLYSYSPAPSCCTPAVLYPNNTVHKVIDYLGKSHCRNGYGKDSILDELRNKENLPAYVIEPNVFQHIGAYSSLRSSLINSQFV